MMRSTLTFDNFYTSDETTTNTMVQAETIGNANFFIDKVELLIFNDQGRIPAFVFPFSFDQMYSLHKLVFCTRENFRKPNAYPMPPIFDNFMTTMILLIILISNQQSDWL